VEYFRNPPNHPFMTPPAIRGIQRAKSSPSHTSIHSQESALTLSDIRAKLMQNSYSLTMSHYISPNLINHPPKLFCQLAGCNIPIHLEPYPPPFSLLLAASAELAPSERDVRRFFCSEEHRDQCWKTEKGWFDRRVAMPSVSLSWPRLDGDADNVGESGKRSNGMEITSIKPPCV